MPSKCIDQGASIPYCGLDGNAGRHPAMHDFPVCAGKSPAPTGLRSHLRSKPATPGRRPMRANYQQCMYGAIRTSAVDGSLHGPVSTGLVPRLYAHHPGPAHSGRVSIALHFAIQAFESQQGASSSLQHLCHIRCHIHSDIHGLVCGVAAPVHLDRTIRQKRLQRLHQGRRLGLPGMWHSRFHQALRR